MDHKELIPKIKSFIQDLDILCSIIEYGDSIDFNKEIEALDKAIKIYYNNESDSDSGSTCSLSEECTSCKEKALCHSCCGKCIIEKLEICNSDDIQEDASDSYQVDIE